MMRRADESIQFTKELYIEDVGPRKIKSIKFSTFSEADIIKLAEVQVYKDKYYDEKKKPVEGGLLDPRMGPPSKFGFCATCHNSFRDCPGHYGCLILALPVYNVGYLSTIVDLLKCICKVVAEHGWAELSKQVFGYQSTSSSHNLKKHYEMLLRDFEEVYYVRNGNSSLVTTGSGNVDGSSSSLQHVSGTPIMSLKPGSSINGVVEAKCPWGYLVTVEGGNEKVHEGFMYHVPEEEVTRAAAAVESQAGQESPTEDPLIIRPPDQYCYFYEEMKDKLKPLYGRHESDMNKKILLMWNRLSDTEKQGWRRR